MNAEVFGLVVSLTQSVQSQTTESNPRMHWTPSASRSSTHLTPPAPVPTIDKADEMILQDTLQVSLAKHKSREEQEARENGGTVNDEPNIPGTRLKPRSEKESPEVEITNYEEEEITNVVIPVNVNDEEEEITDEVYELKRREKWEDCRGVP
ncbi:hypothetical protein Tco_0341633 [Tanacetum coccineum]